jgi:hypothetical protein
MSHWLIEPAAHNNALWCDAVCRVHGRPGEFHDGLWLNRLGTPAFYPDVVTLAGPPPGQMRAIAALIEQRPGRLWAVKDSFACLDLRPLGFAPLFDAAWIGLDSDTPQRLPLPADHRSTLIHSPAELALWEEAWAGERPAASPTFRPALLTDDILFVAIMTEGRIVGGGILNRGAGVVGLSNVFARRISAESVWSDLVTRARHAFPGQPLVGYEQAGDLAAPLRAGFIPLGNLQVWLSTP